MRIALYGVLAVAALVPHTTPAAANRLDDRMERSCNLDYSVSRCMRACADAESKRGHGHAYEGVSHLTQKTCDALLRAAEARRMKGHKVCDASVCRYKLDLLKTTKDGLTKTYGYGGYRVTARPAPVPPYAGGYIYSLRDRSGRTTRFKYCGSCDISNLGYMSGPLKKARIVGGTETSIVLVLPRH
jgi:hypothetical protein